MDDTSKAYLLRSRSNDRGSSSSPKLGVRRAKKVFNLADVLMLLCVWACFPAAIVTVRGLPSFPSIPWTLGVSRQFQIIGALLTIMYQASKPITSKFFLLIEANTHSYLQNYDAILRNTFLHTKTQILWRATLFFLMVLPIGLSVAYKNFDNGIGYADLRSGGNNYGLVPLMGLNGSSAGSIGLSLMANSTLSFILATSNDPEIPPFPQAYGYNILLLSSTSSARLDLPVPSYVQQLQDRLRFGEAYTLTADVKGIVTSYNESAEADRKNSAFWDYHLSMLSGSSGQYISGNMSDMDNYLAASIHSRDMYNNYTLDLLMNDIRQANTSWLLTSFRNSLESSNVQPSAFRASAMAFETRRESCKGTWKITSSAFSLVSGSCDRPRLPDQFQLLLTNGTLALPTFYLPALCEYLQPFSTIRNTSAWKVSSFATIMAGMYWSRLCIFNNGDLTKPQDSIMWASQASYHVQDLIVSERPVMRQSAWLFVVLGVFPILVSFAFLGYLFLCNRVPLDATGFGVTALLAGVRPETLALLDGASTSGKLKRPVRIVFEDTNAYSDDLVEARENMAEIHYLLRSDDRLRG